MPRTTKDRLGGAELDQLADVHHGDPIADVLDHRKIVGHEEQGQAQTLLELEEEIQHLRLHRDVQRGHRLVGHHEPGLGCQGPRDADPLALAARKRVRKAVHVLGAQTGQLEQRGHALERGPDGLGGR